MDMEVEWFTQLIASGLMMSAVMLICGGLLCFRGLRIYKLLQFLLCGLLGASIGLGLHAQFGGGIYYAIAVILGVIGGCIGYKHYKMGLYICASVSTYLVVAMSFLHAAYEMVRVQIESIPDTTTLAFIWLAKIKEAGNLTAATTSVIGEQTSEVIETIRQAMDLIQKGMLYALIASVVVGILAILFGDFIIIFFTSSLGSAILVMMVERYIQVNTSAHITLLCIFAFLGIVFQYIRKKNT